MTEQPKRMGRPRRTDSQRAQGFTKMNFNLPNEMKEKLEDSAWRNRTTMTEIVMRALAAHFAAEEQE